MDKDFGIEALLMNYADAKETKDARAIKKALNDLASVGMDKFTAEILLPEIMKGE